MAPCKSGSDDDDDDDDDGGSVNALDCQSCRPTSIFETFLTHLTLHAMQLTAFFLRREPANESLGSFLAPFTPLL